MKRIIQLTLLLVAVLLLPISAFAEQFYYNGIYYETDYDSPGDRNVRVIGSNGYGSSSYSGDITIPSKVYNSNYSDIYDESYAYTVTSISSDAFAWCGNLSSIRLPSTLISIGYGAFSYCSSLRSVEFSYYDEYYGYWQSNDVLTTISDRAFYECSNLSSINIPSSATSIGSEAFAYCTSLTSIDIPYNVTSMGYKAFYGCTKLEDVNCYSSVIGESAFEDCTALDYISFGWGEQDSVSVRDFAFKGCTALTSIEIPFNVKSIGKSIFAGCSKLTSITVDSHNLRYDSRDNCKAIIETSSNTLVAACKNTTIPSTVTAIGEYAYNGIAISSITLPSSITTIGNYAFYNCSNLSSITMPNVTTIGNYAFYNCSNLSGITMPNVTSIGGYTFNKCSNLSSITLPTTLTSIGNHAFNNCTRLTNISIPNSVTTIGSNAFYQCTSLTSATIGSSVNSIGTTAFGYCTSLETLVVDGGNTRYDSRDECNAIIETGSNKLIQGCKNTTIPNSVILIGDSAFYYCTSLTGITIPNSVTTIGKEAFAHCNALISIVIPNSVTTIGDYAFAYCGNLSSVDMPTSIRTIGTNVFYQTAWWNNQPDGVIYAGLIAYSYKGTMPSGSSVSIREGTIAIAKGAFSHQSGLSSIYIPNSVTFIGDEAFCYCEWLSSVIIPDSVTTIGSSAFYGCYRLSEVTIGSSITSIGASAFYPEYYDYSTGEISSSLSKVYISDLDAWCSISFTDESSNPCTYAHHLYLNGEEIHNLVIPSTVTSIKDFVFKGCSGITSVEIPNSVTSIGGYAFNGCSSLVSVSLGNSIKFISNNAFEVGNYDYYTGEYTTSLTSVNITDLDAWCNISFVDQSSNPCTYAHHLYLNGEEIHHLVIPNTVTSIKKYAFYGCSGITSVEIPSSVTTIGNYSFIGTSGLKELKWNAVNCSSNGGMTTSNLERVTIGQQVETIPSYFAKGSKITTVFIPNAVKTIGSSAFQSCTQLRNMFFNAINCTSVGSNAFYSTNNVNYLQFGDSVEHIPSGLPSITMTNKRLVLPNSVRTIEAGAFKGSCSGVVLGKSIESLVNNTFPSGMKIAYTDKTEPIPCESGTFASPQTLYVPLGSRMKYFTATGWSEFANILEGEYVRVDSILFDKNVAIPRTYTCQLSTTLVPSNATATTLNWMSDNTNIATVSSTGLITAVAEGETDIIAYVDNTMSICHVTVTPIFVTNITLSDTVLTMTVDDMTSLTATASPSNAENKELEWIIPDNDILATIQVNNNKLNIGALSEGQVTITVRATDGSDVSATCVVNVVSSISVGQLSIAPETANLLIGENQQLNATVLPDKATNKALTWSTSNSTVATVDQNGLVTAVGAGTATITATTVDGSNLTASCAVTVEPNVVLAASIELNQTSASATEGETLQLTATVMPEDATEKTVTWESSNEVVATVDQNGLVTAVAAGTATITATTIDGSGLSASCEVTVNGVATVNNTLDADALSARCGEEKQLAVRMDNESLITALQCDIYLPEGVSIATEDGDYLIDLVPARKAANHTVSTNDLPNGAIRLFITSATSKPFKGNSGDVFILNLVVDGDAESGEYSLDLRNIILSDTEAHPYYAPDLNVPVTIMDYIKGDVNIDGTVNVSDYVATANYILELDPHPFLFVAADIDENLTINVSDLVGVANIALNFMGAPAIYHAPAMGYGGEGLMSFTANCSTISPNRHVVTLDLSNSSAVTAFQMDINLPDGLKLVDASLSDRATASHSLEMTTLASGAYRLLGASMMSKAFADSEGALLTLEIEGDAIGAAVIDGIMLAEPDATLHQHDAMTLALGNSGVHEMMSDVNIYLQDGMVVVESPVASKVQFILPNGMSVVREVKAGRNVYNTGLKGVVIVKVGNQVNKFRL